MVRFEAVKTAVKARLNRDNVKKLAHKAEHKLARVIRYVCHIVAVVFIEITTIKGAEGGAEMLLGGGIGIVALIGFAAMLLWGGES